MNRLLRFLHRLGAEALNALKILAILTVLSTIITVCPLGLVYGLGYLANPFLSLGGKTELDAIMNAGCFVVFFGIFAAFPIYGFTIIIKYFVNLWKKTK